MVLFYLALGSPAPQTACRLPDILQPLCLCSCGASSWVTSPSQVGPVRVHSLPGLKARTCFLSFQELFSHSLPHSLGKLRCPVLCVVLNTQGNLHCTVSLYLFADYPSCPLMAPHDQQPLSQPQSGAWHHFLTCTRWWHISENRVGKRSEVLGAPRTEGSDCNRQEHPALLLLGLVPCHVP